MITTLNKKKRAILRLTPNVVVPASEQKKRAILSMTPTAALPASEQEQQAIQRLTPNIGVPASDQKKRARTSLTPKVFVPAFEQKKRANLSLTPTAALPAFEKDQQATACMLPTSQVPATLLRDGDRAKQPVIPMPHLPDPITTLREYQAQRVAVVRAQIRINNATVALARRCLGWQPDMAEADRKKINAEASKLVDAIEDGKEIPPERQHVADVIAPFVYSAKASRSSFDTHRSNLEKSMRAAAMNLPVWIWADGIKGFGALGLAIIVGEAGDIGGYGNPGKLWKRMGLAVFNGKSQRRVTDAAEAIVQGYNPRRRSAMYTLGDSLIKCSEGPYRQIYLDRKAYEQAHAPEGMTKLHIHRRAQRYMEKQLLRDLWRAWRAL